MANLGVVITLTGRDMASGAIGSVIGSLGGLGRAANEVNTSLGSIGRAIQSGMGFGAGLALVRGIGDAMTAARNAALGLNMSLEGARIALGTFIGDGQKAAQFLSQLQTFAAKTPFEFPDLLSATRRMMALGFQAEQIIPLLTNIGNVMSSSGQISTDAVNGVVLAMIQVASKGRLAAQEINQFAERGIPVFDMLQQRFGWTRAEIMKLGEAGRITASMFFEAWQEFAGQTKFAGMMQKMSQTFEGAINNMKDGFSLLFSGAFEPFYNKLRDIAVAIANFLVTPEMRTFAESWKLTFAEILSGFGAVEEAAKSAWEALKQGNAEGFFQGILTAIGELGSAMFGAAWDIATEFARGLMDAGGSIITAAAQSVAGIVAAFLGHSMPTDGPLTSVGEGGRSVGMAWIEGVDQAISSNMNEVAQNVAGFFERINTSISLDAGRASLEANRNNLEGLEALLEQTQDSITAIERGLREWQNQSADLKAEAQDIKDAYEGIREPFEAVQQILEDQIDVAHEYAQSIIDPLEEQLDLLDQGADALERQVDALKKARDWTVERAKIEDQILDRQLAAAKIQAEGDPQRRAELVGQLTLVRLNQQESSLREDIAGYDEKIRDAKKGDKKLSDEALRSILDRRREAELELQLLGLQNKDQLARIAHDDVILKARSEQRDIQQDQLQLERSLEALPMEEKLEAQKLARLAITDQIEAAKREEEKNVKILQRQIDLIKKRVEGLKREEKERVEVLTDQARILDRQIDQVQRQRRGYQDLVQDIKDAIQPIKEAEAAAKKAAAAAQADTLKNAPLIKDLPLDRKEIEDKVGEAARAAATSFTARIKEFFQKNSGPVAAAIAGYIFGESFLAFLGPLAGPVGAVFMVKLMEEIEKLIPGFQAGMTRVFTNALLGLKNAIAFLASGSQEDLAKLAANLANLVPPDSIPAILNFTSAVRDLGSGILTRAAEGLTTFAQALRGDWSAPAGTEWIHPFTETMGNLGLTLRELGKTISEDLWPKWKQGWEENSGTFEAFGKGLSDIGVAFKDDLLPQMRVFVENLGTPTSLIFKDLARDAPTAGNGVRTLADGLEKVNQNIEPLSKILVGGAMILGAIQLARGLTAISLGLAGLTLGIGPALGALGGLAAFLGTGGLIALGIVFLITLIAGFALAWITNFEDIQGKTAAITEQIRSGLEQWWTQVQADWNTSLERLRQAWDDTFFAKIGESLERWKVERTASWNAWHVERTEAWNKFLDDLHRVFEETFGKIGAFFDRWRVERTEAWNKWHVERTTAWNNFLTDLGETWKNLWNGLAGVAETGWNALIGFVDRAFAGLKEKWENFLKSLPPLRLPWQQDSSFSGGGGGTANLRQASLQFTGGRISEAALQRAASQGYDLSALLGITANESGRGTSALAVNNNNMFGVKGRAPGTWSVFESPDEALSWLMNLIQTDPRYAEAFAVRGDPNQFIDALANAGYIQPNQKVDWVNQVKALAGEARGVVGTGGIGGLQRINLGTSQITAFAPLGAQAAANACGPYAAMLFANAVGRYPTAQEAAQIAPAFGWRPNQGMTDASQFDEMATEFLRGSGYHAEAFAPSGNMATQLARAGSPVAFNTPAHYFVGQGYDAATGKFNVGATGTVLPGGKEQMTYQEIVDLGGGIYNLVGILKDGAPAIQQFSNNLVQAGPALQAVGTSSQFTQQQMATFADQQGRLNTLLAVTPPFLNETNTAFALMGQALPPVFQSVAEGTISSESLARTLVEMANGAGLAAVPMYQLESGQINLNQALGATIEAAANVDSRFRPLAETVRATGEVTDATMLDFLNLLGAASGLQTVGPPTAQSIDTVKTSMQNASTEARILAIERLEELKSKFSEVPGFAQQVDGAIGAIRSTINNTSGALDKNGEKWGEWAGDVGSAVNRANEAISRLQVGNFSGVYELYNIQNEFRAEGGPVRRGIPYIVGERGWELFIPTQNGVVIPNSLAEALAGRGEPVVLSGSRAEASRSSTSFDPRFRGGGNTYYVTVNMPNYVGNVRDAARVIRTEFLKIQRDNGGHAGFD